MSENIKIKEATQNPPGQAVGVERSVSEFAQNIKRLIPPLAYKLSITWYRLAEKSYTYHHGSLPGSNKTKRLRKKRRDKVLDWFTDNLKCDR